MNTIFTGLFSLWCILKFIITGAFLQKWKMQAVFNYKNLAKIAPLEEVQTAGLYLFLGIAGLFIIIIILQETYEYE